MPSSERGYGGKLFVRLGERRRFIQVVAGARQVGKTTLVRQVLFVVKIGSATIAIEVKSSRTAERLSGIAAFVDAHRPSRTLLVGPGGMSVEEFLSRPIRELA